MSKKIAIIGGGFYGIMAAIEAAKFNGDFKVTLFEKKAQLFSGAGKYNQARAHLGFHYPRSSATIKQSKIGFDFYKKNFPTVMQSISKNIYLIREDGYVSVDEYLETMREHKLDFEIIDMKISAFKYKDYNLPHCAIRVDEHFIDCSILENLLKKNLDFYNIKVLTNSNVLDVDSISGSVKIENKENTKFDMVINCTYTNPFLGFGDNPINLKFEYCMMLLITSQEINNEALTIMDGEFVSIYPWLNGIHSVSSVKYTPIFKANNFSDLYEKMKNISQSEIEHHANLIESHMNRFVSFKYSKISHFLVPKMKVLNDIGDQRIVQTYSQNKCFSVLPGKLDAVNIFLSDLKSHMENIY